MYISLVFVCVSLLQWSSRWAVAVSGFSVALCARGVAVSVLVLGRCFSFCLRANPLALSVLPVFSSLPEQNPPWSGALGAALVVL